MKSKQIGVGLIGCGYWGPNLLRNCLRHPQIKVVGLAERDASRRSFVQDSSPQVPLFEEADDLLRAEGLDAVIIATPAGTHFELAKAALACGKHILVEKPLATSLEEVDSLGRLAKEKGCVVMAGHTFLYNAAVRYAKELIDSGELGEVRYLYSQRLNLGRIRSDIDALWNFAPHDISIIQYLLNDLVPLDVHRVGMDFMQPGIDDVVFMNMVYPNKVMAHVHVSWLDPQKVRRLVVVGSKRMLVYDDVSENKIILYDKGVDIHHALGESMDYDKPAPFNFDYRSGDIVIPKINFTEPLYGEISEFVESIQEAREPLSGIDHARTVVEILERATHGKS